MTPRCVLHVIASLEGGGVERLLVKSLAQFDRREFSHAVCCISKGGAYAGELQALGVPYWIMNRRARLDPTLIGQMARLMRRQQVDVVHTYNFTANAWGRVAARLARVPKVIAHERGTVWTENALMRLVDRLLYPFTDVLIANSQATRMMLTRRLSLPPNKIRVIHNGLPQPAEAPVSLFLREQLGMDAETPLIGTVGRLDTPKGLTFLLRAIPLVWESSSSAHFVILGDGPLRGHLENAARQMGLFPHPRVHFLGFRADAAERMGELDVLVHSAIRESLGNVLIEAGWARVPVVTSNVDGCPEVVVDGETGLLIDCTEPVKFVPAPGVSPLPKVVVDGRTRQLRPPRGPSPQALAEAALTLLRDASLRRRMGQNGFERARSLFSLERYVRDLEHLY